jgi:hypothetical protein
MALAKLSAAPLRIVEKPYPAGRAPSTPVCPGQLALCTPRISRARTLVVVRAPWVAAACLLAAVLATVTAHAEPPSADDVEAARTHYRLGVQLYGERKYEEALVELQRASALAPTFRLFYDIGLVQRQLGDAAGALRSFGEYLDVGVDLPAARRAEVLRAIAELTLKVATVTVTSTVTGTEISDNDRVVGKTPLAGPLHVNPGPHRISASKEGYHSVTRSIDVSGGDRADVPFSLEELGPPPPAPDVTPPAVSPPASVLPAAPPAPSPVSGPPSEPSAPPEAPSVPTWIGWAATGALAAGAVGTGIAAVVQSNTLRSEIDDRATPGATIHAAHATTATLALVSDILTGAAVAVAGVTFYVKVTSKPRFPVPSGRAEVRAGPGSVWLSATF